MKPNNSNLLNVSAKVNHRKNKRYNISLTRNLKSSTIRVISRRFRINLGCTTQFLARNGLIDQRTLRRSSSNAHSTRSTRTLTMVHITSVKMTNPTGTRTTACILRIGRIKTSTNSSHSRTTAIPPSATSSMRNSESDIEVLLHRFVCVLQQQWKNSEFPVLVIEQYTILFLAIPFRISMLRLVLSMAEDRGVQVIAHSRLALPCEQVNFFDVIGTSDIPRSNMGRGNSERGHPSGSVVRRDGHPPVGSDVSTTISEDRSVSGRISSPDIGMRYPIIFDVST
mgnify:CR=1 FL=1